MISCWMLMHDLFRSITISDFRMFYLPGIGKGFHLGYIGNILIKLVVKLLQLFNQSASLIFDGLIVSELNPPSSSNWYIILSLVQFFQFSRVQWFYPFCKYILPNNIIHFEVSALSMALSRSVRERTCFAKIQFISFSYNTYPTESKIKSTLWYCFKFQGQLWNHTQPYLW